MPNYSGNPKIAEYGKSTRFGQSNGPDPKAAQQLAITSQPVRHAVKRIGAASVDITKPITLETILRAAIPKGQERMVDYIAAGLLLAALEGDSRAWDRVVNITDGPTPTEAEVKRVHYRS